MMKLAIPGKLFLLDKNGNNTLMCGCDKHCGVATGFNKYKNKEKAGKIRSFPYMPRRDNYPFNRHIITPVFELKTECFPSRYGGPVTGHRLRSVFTGNIQPVIAA